MEAVYANVIGWPSRSKCLGGRKTRYFWRLIKRCFAELGFFPGNRYYNEGRDFLS